MVIDFIFERGFSPWEEIEIICNGVVEKIRLEKTSSRTRRIQLSEIKESVSLIKKNIWLDGIEEVFFSIDGVFYNTFNTDRLPYSLEIPISLDTQNRIINIPNDVDLNSDSKSQKRWKIATFIQIAFFILFLVFCTIVFSLAFSKLWRVFVIVGIVLGLTVIKILINKTKRILTLINSCIKH